MKKGKIIFGLLLSLLAIGFLYFINVIAPLISGYGAKMVCSCAYVGDRDLESILENEVGRGAKALGNFSLDYTDSSATGSVWGFAESKAVYRKGLGCTMLHEISAEELKGKLASREDAFKVLSDTLEWPKGTMVSESDEQGVDTDKLWKAIHRSFENPDPKKPNNQRAVVVVHKGKIIAEKHDDEFGPNKAQIGWSMSKSVTSALFGILAKEKGFDIYAPAPIAEWKGDERSAITTDQLLRMSSGLEWDEIYSNASTATNMLYNSQSMGAYAASFPLESEVGSVWEYSSGTSNILSRILAEELGEEYLDFPYKELFHKIGMTTVTFEVDASNQFVGSSYIWASPRDWARLGLLYLQDGVWNDERILPEGWVDYSRTSTPPAEMQQYGAQFWLNTGDLDNPSNRRLPDCPRELYSMNGYEGQRVYILPSKDLVVVTMAQTDKGVFDMNDFMSEIIAAFD